MKRWQDYEWNGAGRNTWRAATQYNAQGHATEAALSTAWVAAVVVSDDPAAPRGYEALGTREPMGCPSEWPALTPWYRSPYNPKNCHATLEQAQRESLRMCGIDVTDKEGDNDDEE